MKYTDLMIDIETMGKDSILSIGAVPFNLQEGLMAPPSTCFYERATLQASIDAGGSIDPNTVEWWLKQSKEAQDALLEEPRYDSMAALLRDFYNYMDQSQMINHAKGAMTIWAKPPEFDLVILEKFFTRLGMRTPWTWFQGRDVRTVETMAKLKGMTIKKPDGVAHDALADAIHQTKSVIGIVQAFKGMRI